MKSPAKKIKSHSRRVEKDAGEEITWNPDKKQYGFDYNSFHAQVLNKGKIKNLKNIYIKKISSKGEEKLSFTYRYK